MSQCQAGGRPGLLLHGFLIFLFLLVWSATGQAALHPREPLPEYRLQVSFDLPRGKVLGRATILAPQGRKLTIDPGKLDILEIRHRGEKITSGRRTGKDIVLFAQGPIQVDYELSLKKTGDTAMNQRDLILLSGWYPQVEGFCRFKLTATLPSGYLAISEADQVTHTEKDGQVEFVFDFPYPLHDSGRHYPGGLEPLGGISGESEQHRIFDLPFSGGRAPGSPLPGGGQAGPGQV